jgi:hypothetical protein
MIHTYMATGLGKWGQCQPKSKAFGEFIQCTAPHRPPLLNEQGELNGALVVTADDGGI